MPAPRAVPTALNAVLVEALALYDGLFSHVDVVRQFDDTLPAVRLDADQFKRVVINLVDNAIEAMEHRGQIVVETSRDPVHALVRVVVADDGPGHPRRSSATSCSCRTTRPSGAAPGSAWPSSGGSSPSTAATSK